VTSNDVRRCREETGLSMMECKARMQRAEDRAELRGLLNASVRATTVDDLKPILTQLISILYAKDTE